MTVFVSWSGGKDSALALYRALKDVKKVDILFTMLDETCMKTRAHGLKRDVIERQARAIGVDVIFGCASWETYEAEFLKFLERYATNGVGIFGDIDLEDHRKWVEGVCGRYNVKALEPLWLEDRRRLIEEFINLGFKAKIVVVKKGFEDLLGLDLHDYKTIELIESLGIDLAGENGEYHTLVYDGPIMKYSLSFEIKGVRENEKNVYLLVE
ncbi:MAG: diphthine--ammonia ligase [Thermosulfidibacteraceae bacterium]|jgi:uncharacterized protein (TIGR00290 family)